MKKSKMIIMTMVISMLLGCVMPAANTTVSANNRLVKKATYYVGQKQQWWMTLNFKKVNNKKVKWKSSNKKVATVSKKGVIKAKKKGKAKITAKYKKNTLVIKITVKENLPVYTGNYAVPSGSNTGASTASNSNTNVLTANQLAANMTVQAQPLKDGTVLFAVTNNNSQMIQRYTINYKFNNVSGVVVGTGNTHGYVIQPGQTQYTYSYVGKDEAAVIDVKSSACSISVENYNYSPYIDETANVSVDAQTTSDNDITFTFTNKSINNVDIINIIVYYDAAGQIVGSDRESVYGLTPGETKFTTVDTPYDRDDDFNKIPTFSTYKVFSTAYSY